MPEIERKQTKRTKEEQLEYEDFTFMAHMMFKTLGYDLLNTARPSWQSVLMRCYFVLCIVSNYYEVALVGFRIIQWDSVAGSPSKIMRRALDFFYMFSAQVKFVTFMIYRKRLRALIQGLRDLYPTDESLRREYEVERYYLPRRTRYVLYFYYFVIMVLALGPLLQSIVMYLLQGSDAQFPFLRIYPTQLSFRSDTPIGYAVAYTLDFIYSQFIVNVTLGTDLWMMCASSQICMHFGYLAKKLGAYCPSREREQEDCDFMASLAQRHQLILRLHEELDQVFGLLLASNLFTTASLLCCMAFYTVVEGLSSEGITYMLLFGGIAAQFYVICSYVQRLMDLSVSISTAAYLQNWYDGSIRYQKELLLVMARAQRPAEISAWGIVIISLDTFKILMTMTYRFFTIIRQTVEK